MNFSLGCNYLKQVLHLNFRSVYPCNYDDVIISVVGNNYVSSFYVLVLLIEIFYVVNYYVVDVDCVPFRFLNRKVTLKIWCAVKDVVEEISNLCYLALLAITIIDVLVEILYWYAVDYAYVSFSVILVKLNDMLVLVHSEVTKSKHWSNAALTVRNYSIIVVYYYAYLNYRVFYLDIFSELN